MNLIPGQQLGTYRVIRLLGQGGMGAVYEVEHTQLGVHYALKTFVLADGHADLFRKRFSAEGKILARLNHPGVVRVFDLDIDERTGVPYYVMDLVVYKDGNAYSLADLEQGGADEEHLAQWFAELCRALAYIHSHGIVHRDIKLNNILIKPEDHVVISDFGISKIRNEKLRTEVDVSKTFVTDARSGGRLVMGTEGYMAPEVQRGEEVTPAADVYSLGVVFFKLLTGVWYEPDMAKGDRTALRLLDHFDRPWTRILPAMLDASPAKRPDNLMALAEIFNHSAPPDAPVRRFPKWARWAAGGGLAAATAVGVWLSCTGPKPDLRGITDEDLARAFTIPECLK